MDKEARAAYVDKIRTELLARFSTANLLKNCAGRFEDGSYLSIADSPLRNDYHVRMVNRTPYLGTTNQTSSAPTNDGEPYLIVD